RAGWARGTAWWIGGGPGIPVCGWTRWSHPVAASTTANDAFDAAVARTTLRMRKPPGRGDVRPRRVPAPQRPVVPAVQDEVPVREVERREPGCEGVVLAVERDARRRVEP